MKVLVLLSGGQDSTTCLYWALDKFGEVHAVTFDYGQRHAMELVAAERIASQAGVKSYEVIPVGKVLKSTSPLVNTNVEVGSYGSAEELPGGVEPTFVPGRNALFLVLAANRAEVLEVRDLVIGVGEEDFIGYFDCRKRFMTAMMAALSVGFSDDPTHFTFHTPLMDLTKKQTVLLAKSLPGCWEALAHSHTCYNGIFPPCGTCHACILRARGFEEAGFPDPLLGGME